MGNFLLSITSPELLSWVGFVVLAIALVGEAAVWIFPKTLEATAAFVFAILAASGYAVERVGDDAIIDALKNRATIAESAFTKIKAPRTLRAERQQAVADVAQLYRGQRYQASISQGADDGLVFWESLYATLEKAGWIYLPATLGMGNPPAGVPIVAIPGVEIRFDPDKEQELAPAALALGNALHADGMVVAVNRNRQSNPNAAERDILQIVIGVRVPPP
jgi:hypothetical protein